MENKPKCEKCRRELKKSGPYAHLLFPNGTFQKEPIETYFWCNYEDCKNYSEVIIVNE